MKSNSRPAALCAVLLVVLLLMWSPVSAEAQYRIRTIYIEQKDVFSEEEENMLFVFPLLNSLHIDTRLYVIEDELLFEEGELLDEELLAETERNLLATGYFKSVAVQVDYVNDFDADVYVVVQERWTTMPYVKVQTGGGYVNVGAGLREVNLAGVGTRLALYAGLREENDIGAEGEIAVEQPRLFRTELTLGGRLKADQYRTDQYAYVLKPFRTLDTRSAFYAGYVHNFGSDFYYGVADSVLLLPFRERGGDLWYSHAFPRKDRYFITGRIAAMDVERIDHIFRRAFDNSARALLGFSSLKQEYFTMRFVNSFGEEHLSIGAWGTAILGRIVPMRSGGEQLYYAGGQVEQSVLVDDRLYLSGQVSAGSAFKGSDPRYTYQEFLGHAFYRVSPRSLLTARVRQQTAWNWTAFRQLVLDNDAGLRGYPANELTGENRILANVEYRVFPDLSLMSFQFSGVLFYDVGTVWNQNRKLHRAPVYHSVGAGLRIHNEQLFGQYAMFRVDVPYNVHKGGLGQIVLSVGQVFPAFKHPHFEAPKIFGEDIDVR